MHGELRDQPVRVDRSGAVRALIATATACTAAPSCACGWVCVTAALRRAAAATTDSGRPGTSPIGATRIAAPLPREPSPSNSPAATRDHSAPSWIWRSTAMAPGP